MDEKELHKFGLQLHIAYLYRQKGELIRANANIGNEYPHLVAKIPTVHCYISGSKQKCTRQSQVSFQLKTMKKLVGFQSNLMLFQYLQ
jgi:hypothetical protein